MLLRIESLEDLYIVKYVIASSSWDTLLCYLKYSWMNSREYMFYQGLGEGMVVTERTWFRAMTMMCHHSRSVLQATKVLWARVKGLIPQLVQLPLRETVLTMAGTIGRHYSISILLSVLQTSFHLSDVTYDRISSVKCVPKMCFQLSTLFHKAQTLVDQQVIL